VFRLPAAVDSNNNSIKIAKAMSTNKFGKKCTNLSLKLGVLIVGKMEQQIYHVPVTFCLAKKVWRNQRISCCFQKNHHI